MSPEPKCKHCGIETDHGGGLCWAAGTSADLAEPAPVPPAVPDHSSAERYFSTSDDDIWPVIQYELEDVQREQVFAFADSLLAEREAELESLRQRLERSHHPYCSCWGQTIGGPGCICATIPKTELADLRTRCERLEQKLQKISFASGNVGIEHPEWPKGYAEHLTALILERDEFRAKCERLEQVLETCKKLTEPPTTFITAVINDIVIGALSSTGREEQEKG